METLTYTTEEMTYIKETLDIVNRDMRNIYNLSLQENLFLKFNLRDEEEYLLCIGPKQIAIVLNGIRAREEELKVLFKKNTNFDDVYDAYRLENGFYKIKKGERIYYRAPLNIYKPEVADVVIRFLAKYEEIRKELINIAESRNEEKEQLLEALKPLRKKYGSEVLVDLGTSQTQNMQKIEVSEENGKKIGTIDFGNRIVKIITEGDIVLTKIERAKTKIKQ